MKDIYKLTIIIYKYIYLKNNYELVSSLIRFFIAIYKIFRLVNKNIIFMYNIITILDSIFLSLSLSLCLARFFFNYKVYKQDHDLIVTAVSRFI